MGINVAAARIQAVQLNDNAFQLKSAKNKLKMYRSVISDNWSGKEVPYILAAIDETMNDINKSIKELESLSRDIKQVAEQIKREEEAAAAAAAAAAKQQRINKAQAEYDEACKELDDLNEKKASLIKKIAKASSRDKIKLAKDMLELDLRIKAAELNCESKFNSLKAAKR